MMKARKKKQKPIFIVIQGNYDSFWNDDGQEFDELFCEVFRNITLDKLIEKVRKELDIIGHSSVELTIQDLTNNEKFLYKYTTQQVQKIADPDTEEDV